MKRVREVGLHHLDNFIRGFRDEGAAVRDNPALSRESLRCHGLAIIKLVYRLDEILHVVLR